VFYICSKWCSTLSKDLGIGNCPHAHTVERFAVSRMSRHIITITVQWVALGGIKHIMWLSQNLLYILLPRRTVASRHVV
jgi:hypothetical protein